MLIKKCVANIIFNSERQILFLKRAGEHLEKFHPNVYCLPGGGIDGGEYHYTSAIRETREECGLSRGIEYNLLSYEPKTFTEGNCVIHYFISVLTHDAFMNFITLDQNEHSNYEWMNRERWLEENLILQLKDHLLKIFSNG